MAPSQGAGRPPAVKRGNTLRRWALFDAAGRWRDAEDFTLNLIGPNHHNAYTHTRIYTDIHTMVAETLMKKTLFSTFDIPVCWGKLRDRSRADASWWDSAPSLKSTLCEEGDAHMRLGPCGLNLAQNIRENNSALCHLKCWQLYELCMRVRAGAAEMKCNLTYLTEKAKEVKKEQRPRRGSPLCTDPQESHLCARGSP